MEQIIQQWYQYLLAQADSLWRDPNLPWVVVGVALGCVFACWAYAFYVYRSISRPGDEMGGKRKQLSKAERILIEDALTEALEDAVFKGTCTRKRARYWYSRFATDYGLFGLVPRRRKKVANGKASYLKEQIKGRLANGLFKPVSIPGPLPWEDQRPSSKTKMRAFLASRK